MDTLKVLNMTDMFDGCKNIKNFNPLNFSLFDFSVLPHLEEDYPEYFI